MNKFLFLLLLLILPACQSEEARMKEEIHSANYCEVKEDCQMIQSVCPFDCYVLVHRDEATKINALIQGYESSCIYSCIEAPDYDCIDQRCEFLR